MYCRIPCHPHFENDTSKIEGSVINSSITLVVSIGQLQSHSAKFQSGGVFYNCRLSARNDRSPQM